MSNTQQIEAAVNTYRATLRALFALAPKDATMVQRIAIAEAAAAPSL